MNRLFNHICLTMIVLFVMVGCFPSAPPVTTMRYYALDYPVPQVTINCKEKTTLRIERIVAAPPFTSPDMIWQMTPYTRDRKRYERWYAPPAQMVEQLLLRDLTQAYPGILILSREVEGDTRYLLEGNLTEFLAQVQNRKSVARIRLTVTLRDLRVSEGEKRWLWNKVYEIETPLTASTSAEMARGMSVALSHLSSQVITDLAPLIGCYCADR